MENNVHVFAYKENGQVWAWGTNSYGQIGDNTRASYSSPVQIVGNHSFMFVNAGMYHSMFLKQNGECWTCGHNDIGDLGILSRISYSSPVQVVGNHSFIQVSPGITCSYALKENGEAWSWGFNTGGLLGTNNVVSYSSPVQVVGNHSFVSLKGGCERSHGMAAGLKSDGSLWTWGMNDYGQLGTNDGVSYSSPVQVVGNHSFIDFSFGARSAYGFKADGTVWSWGYNAYGELGTNNRTNYSSPVQVVGNHSFVSFIASMDPNLQFYGYTTVGGLKQDGSVWTWGFGKGIGNGTLNSYSSPVQVIGNHSFWQLKSMGGPCFICLKGDGSAWTWGTNSWGQLGDGTITDRTSPVQVVGNHSFLTVQTGLNLSVVVSSVWKKRPVGYITKSGAWKRITAAYVNQSSSWKHSCLEQR